MSKHYPPYLSPTSAEAIRRDNASDEAVKNSNNRGLKMKKCPTCGMDMPEYKGDLKDNPSLPNEPQKRAVLAVAMKMKAMNKKKGR